MKEQDAGLDMLSISVARLGQLSMGIAEELGQQNKMLDSMETDLDTASEELGIVTAKTKDLIAKSGGAKNFCIIVSLIIVVGILLFLIIYV
jgi:t-SNARE complex subunit (syntaxin)